MPYTWVTGPVYSDVAITESSFTARDGATVPLRLYRPVLPGASASIPVPDRLPVVVWFHGGGWCLGNLEGYDPLCSWIAHEAQVLVVSVDYRLAPEHAAPQAVHDCLDGVRWVSAQAESLGADATTLGVAGDSAGGNLAAVVTQVLRDSGGPRVGYQCLLYPGTDATMSMPSVRTHAEAPMLTRADMDAFVGYYLGEGSDRLSPSDPLVSPLLATAHHGLPPALVQTADLDPLRDEGLAYAEKLEAAGVPVRVTNYPRTPHGFHSFPGASLVGRAARAELASWIATHSRERLVH
jgi:acetyl esterase